MKLLVVDLGLGNLGSVLQALRRAGGQPHLATEPAQLAGAERIVLPGVAAFGLGMERAERFRGALQDALASGAQVLGICLGMQLLFEEGEEDGARAGLALLPGKVVALPKEVQRPHIGWQKLRGERQGWAYFAHGYHAVTDASLVTEMVEHGGREIVAAVRKGNLRGVQYHPEKSARDGELLLRDFLAA